MSKSKTAVVVGATNGIGKAISCRLAQEGFSVIAVGREKEGRSAEVLKFLGDCSDAGSGATKDCKVVSHEFRACDAFELAQVKTCAQDIVRDHTSSESSACDVFYGSSIICILITCNFSS